MNPVTVSYVVPVYNGDRYLAECIASILAQTLRPHEVIVVDDGSVDGTASVAAGFGKRVRYVFQDNGGHSAARNHGARLASGDLLGFFDADDLMLPGKTEAQVACFAARPELQFCDAYLRNFWSPDIPLSERWKRSRSRFTHSEQPRAHSITTWLMRRSLFDRVGRFDESLVFGEDDDWYRRMQGSGASCATLDQVVSRRRLHGNNLTLVRYDEYLSCIVRRRHREVSALSEK
jgi:glycosyltransferase involved in cell wall biosynthesis